MPASIFSGNRALHLLSDIAGSTATRKAYVFDDRPDRFVELCRKIKLLSSDLLSGDMELPYWYWKVVHEKLTKFKYHPSDIELREAAAYLRRSNKKIGPTIVSKLIGSQYILRARKFRSKRK